MPWLLIQEAGGSCPFSDPAPAGIQGHTPPRSIGSLNPYPGEGCQPPGQASQPVPAQPPYGSRRRTRNTCMFKFPMSPAGRKSAPICSTPMRTQKAQSHASRARALCTVLEDTGGKPFGGRADAVPAAAPDEASGGTERTWLQDVALPPSWPPCTWGVSCSRDSGSHRQVLAASSDPMSHRASKTTHNTAECWKCPPSGPSRLLFPAVYVLCGPGSCGQTTYRVRL